MLCEALTLTSLSFTLTPPTCPATYHLFTQFAARPLRDGLLQSVDTTGSERVLPRELCECTSPRRQPNEASLL